MNRLVKTLLLGGSATAMLAGAAYAQNAAESTLDVEEIQSSVSRIDLKGFEAPTPVTVVGIEQLNRDAKVQLGEQLRELPQIRGGGSLSAGSMSGNLVQANAGTDSVAIRGLGAQRNLVLFDRQRVVATYLQDGVVDLALIPAGLTQRVDVVTGGASAAWGSDAVTGVINIVINKTFEGFKGSAQYSDSTEIPNPQYKLSLAWGTSFLDGKGHTVFGADFTHADQGVFQGDIDRRTNNPGRGFVINPAYCNTGNIVAVNAATSTCASPNPGQPALIYAYGVGTNTATVGGLVQSSTAGTTGSGLMANSLKGVMFVGENADPQQFYYGTTSNTTTCYNGCTNDQFTGGWGSQNNPYHSSTFFNYTSYQILPDVKASVQLNFARLQQRASGAAIGGNNRVMYADNPYLPDNVAQRFVCNGAQSASCQTVLSNGYNPYTKQYDATLVPSLTTRQGRPTQSLTTNFSLDNGRPTSSPGDTASRDSIQYSWDARCNGLSQNCGYYNKQLMRGVFTLDGVIGDSWTWSAYMSHAQSRVRIEIANNINIRFNNAIDAVRITSGNVGTSGLPIGSIQCRGLLNPGSLSANFANSTQEATANSFGITRTSELAGCVPVNPFGNTEPSNALKNYIRPGLNPSASSANGLPKSQETVTTYTTLSAAAFSMSGVLPWQLPAGEIGVAFGAEWRLHRDGQKDIDGWAQAGLYSSGNFGLPYEGHLHSEEGFLEVAIPILKNDIVDSLSIDLAGRMTQYSFSGLTETWKLGLQSQINEDWRFRMTWSYDLRAPNVFDLYVPNVQSGNNCASFIPGPTGSNGGQPNQCFSMTGGNPTLNPEKANTIAAGIVFTPSFIPGLTASLDWYQIHLHGAIVTPGQTEPLDRCRGGELVYCPLLEFANGLPYPAGTTSAVTIVYRSPINAGVLTTAGFDFGVAYGFDLFTGSATVGFNGNYVYEFGRELNNIFFNGIGQTGGYYSGGARFEGTLNTDYREGPWSFGIQNRITGDSVMSRGTKGTAGIQEQFVQYSSTGVATLSAGERRPGFQETNYNAFVVRTDLRVQYRWSNNITLFGAIDNIQNLPQAGGVFRRVYRGGIRWNY
jgi:outer membrane receptor protein involved in Fe transport